jgi:DNA invertase Pin-like site-specific DNA recombinase
MSRRISSGRGRTFPNGQERHAAGRSGVAKLELAGGRLMLTVLGGLAEFERELIRGRTGEGRKRAQERGVRFGRPRKLTPHQRKEALQRLAAGETQADIARSYAVDATTIGRLSA